MKKFLVVSILVVLAMGLFVSCDSSFHEVVGNATIYLEEDAVFPPDSSNNSYGFVKTDDGKFYQLVFGIHAKTNACTFIFSGDDESEYSAGHEHCFNTFGKQGHDLFNDQTREYYFVNNGERTGKVTKYNKVCRATILEPLSLKTGEIEIYDKDNTYLIGNIFTH